MFIISMNSRKHGVKKNEDIIRRCIGKFVMTCDGHVRGLHIVTRRRAVTFTNSAHEGSISGG